ncbi:MAG: type I 3-dehydroquinate dehydratase [Lachnospiraceae bacterium]|nr:type I 3-dehydroquinate dehydratase [Lachnospiraceae bacterium]
MSKKTVKIRNTEIGAGVPKVCVPIVAANIEEMDRALEHLKSVPYDMVEWRADFYQGAEENETMTKALEHLRRQIKDAPLLFTFRTFAEGGNRAITPEAYRKINLQAAGSRMVDIVDVELFRGECLTEELVKKLHQYRVCVLGSNHDFHETPGEDEICRRLCRMQRLNMDITKIAVMPQRRQDMLTLLAAAVTMEERLADRPCVTMSMGRDGAFSRVMGGYTGSAITFGTAGKSSAPGQLPAEKLKTVLQIMSECIG